MKTIVNNLVQLMQLSTSSKPNLIFNDSNGLFKSINQILEEEFPEKSLENWFQIDLKEFPDSSLLTHIELNHLVIEICKLWVHFNFIPDFDEEYSVEKKYNLLLSQWKEKYHFFSEEIQLIEFCTLYPSTCPIGDSCSCKITWEEEPVSEVELFLGQCEILLSNAN